jgi:hypothetical protein
MYLAIDIGSGLTKVIHSGGEYYFPSVGGVCNDDKNFEYGVKNHEVIFWNNKRYVVGDCAYSMLDPEHRQTGYAKSYYDKDIQLIYLFSSIARIHKDGYDGPMSLVTGLPISVFGEGHERFLSKIIGTHHFSNKNGTKYCVTFHPQTTKVLPQAVGLHFSHLSANPKSGLDIGKYGYIDPGTFTSAYCTIEDNRYIHRLSGGATVGLEKLAKKIKPYFIEQHQWEPKNIEQILKALRVGFIDIYSKSGVKSRLDMREITKLFVPSVYGAMIEEMVNKWDGARDMMVFASSGGGEYVLEEIQKHIPHAQLMHVKKGRKGDLLVNESAFMDVCRGYAVFAKNLDKAMATTENKIVNIK